MIDSRTTAVASVATVRFARAVSFGVCLFALALPACAGGARSAGPTAEFADSVTGFLGGFERAVAAHDWPAAMRYLDPAYVIEQHDTMLEGRTEQFFVELLGLHVACKGVAPAACLKRIRSIRRVRTPGPAAGTGVPVFYRIEMEGADQAVRSEIHLKLGPSPRRFSLFGAVG